LKNHVYAVKLFTLNKTITLTKSRSSYLFKFIYLNLNLCYLFDRHLFIKIHAYQHFGDGDDYA